MKGVKGTKVSKTSRKNVLKRIVARLRALCVSDRSDVIKPPIKKKKAPSKNPQGQYRWTEVTGVIVRNPSQENCQNSTVLVCRHDGNGEDVVPQTLPNELVENILARVPFPYIFTARALSKEWRARLSAISSLNHDDQWKHQAISFQKEVLKRSPSLWTTFCPLGWRNEDLVAYDRTSHAWRRLPSPLSFLPKHLSRKQRNPMQGDQAWAVQVEGPLVLVDIWQESTDLTIPRRDSMYHHLPLRRRDETFVANTLTRSWRQLPPRPQVHGEPSEKVLQKKLVIVSAQTYRVITVLYHFCTRDGEKSLIQIYNSSTGAWSTSSIVLPHLLPQQVYLAGRLYALVPHSPRVSGRIVMAAIGVEEETYEELHVSLVGTARWEEYAQENLVVCNGDLLYVAFYRTTFTFVKIDVRARQMFEEAGGFLGHFDWMRLPFSTFSHGDYVYVIYRGSGLLVYDARKHKWGLFRFQGIDEYVGCAFQPGLNPFIEV